MTAVQAAGHVGYFQDPYPVHLTNGGTTQFFTGTSKKILQCAYPLAPRCFGEAPLQISSKSLDDSIAAAGAAVTNFQNLDAYQDDRGLWHMVMAIGVNNATRAFHWTVIVHASPVGATSRDEVPTSWSADKVLVGSFATPVDGNYDPKLFADGDQLYLIYVRRRPGSDPRRNDIVAQRMTKPDQLADETPVTLLTPGDGNQSFNSELFDTVVDEDDFRLVEVANITRINGKFALAYSVGKYNERNYKTAVAWSDSLLPAAGTTYRKVLQVDAAGVWGVPGHQEIRYLLQSQQPAWSGYVGGQVDGPGVPSIVQGTGGQWYLYFGAFDPGDEPPADGVPAGEFVGSYRRPYYVPLKVTVPIGGTVAAASDAGLAGWLTPMSR